MLTSAFHPHWVGYGFGRHLGADHLHSLPVVPELIPEALKSIPNWVAWDFVEEDSYLRKVPISPRSSMYCNDLPTGTGVSFQAAYTYYAKHGLPGIGFILSRDNPYIAIDIDDCVNPTTFQVEESVRQPVLNSATYSEISPTGTGLRLIAQMTESKTVGVTRLGRAEIFEYDSFVTITGHQLPGTPDYINSFRSSLFADFSQGRRADAVRRSGWFHRAPEPPISEPISVNGQHLFSTKHILHFRDTNGVEPTGWDVTLSDSRCDGGLICDDYIFHYDQDGQLSARVPLGGQVVWQSELRSEIMQLHDASASSILVGTRQLTPNQQEAWRLIRKDTGETIATERGRIVWPTSPTGKPRNLPVRPTGRWFLVSSGQSIECIDRLSGDFCWSIPMPEVTNFDQVDVINGCIVIARFENRDISIIRISDRSTTLISNDNDVIFPYFLTDNESILIIQNGSISRLSLPKCTITTIPTIRTPENLVHANRNYILYTINTNEYCIVNTDNGTISQIHSGIYLASSGDISWIIDAESTIRSISLCSGFLTSYLVVPESIHLLPSGISARDAENMVFPQIAASPNGLLVSNGFTLLEYKGTF